MKSRPYESLTQAAARTGLSVQDLRRGIVAGETLLDPFRDRVSTDVATPPSDKELNCQPIFHMTAKRGHQTQPARSHAGPTGKSEPVEAQGVP